MKIKNVTLVNKVQGRFNMIYDYTDVCDHEKVSKKVGSEQKNAYI